MWGRLGRGQLGEATVPCSHAHTVSLASDGTARVPRERSWELVLRPPRRTPTPSPPPTSPSVPLSSGRAVGQEALASITHTCTRLQVSGPAGDGDQPGVPRPGSLRVHV